MECVNMTTEATGFGVHASAAMLVMIVSEVVQVAAQTEGS